MHIKMKRKFYILIMCLMAVQCGMAQHYHSAPSYNVYDDTLFVATRNGIVYYPLKENDAEWKTYAFSDMRIYAFVKSGANLLAINLSETGFELLRSSDYGATYVDITPADGAKTNYLYYSLYQMPDNQEHVFLVYPPNDVNAFQNNRMKESLDFGESWTVVENASTQDGFFAIDPYNPEHVIVYGLTPYINGVIPYLLETTDNFNTLTQVPFERPELGFYFYSLSFCSANTQKLLATSSHGVYKSTDGGSTWQKDSALSDLNWSSSQAVILYEPNHSQMVFVGRNNVDNSNDISWDIHYSKDSGETWSLLYAAESTTGDEILGMVLYDDNIIVVGSNLDVYRIPINQTQLETQIAYRPMIEDGKVWKFGAIFSGNPVQIVDYYYFDGDTIINGKTCKQMMCQQYVSPEYPNYYDFSNPNSLRKVGAWYEENQKVYFCYEGTQSMRMMYDFSLGANETLYFLNDNPDYPNDRTFIIGPKQTGGIKGFKGVYRDIMLCQNEGQNIHSTFWLEGVGGIDGLTANAFDPTLVDLGHFLMSCTVGDEVIYLNDEYEDGTTSEGSRKDRFDFTHTIKTNPKAPFKQENSDACNGSSEREVAQPEVKAPRRSDEAQSLYGEYNDLLLGIHLDPLDDAYLVSITNESGQIVYEKTINAGTIVGLSIDISAYAKGRYTVTMENSRESFTGEFEVLTTGISDATRLNNNEQITKNKLIYNLQGQRLRSLQKGLNIVNGKKVYVK